MNWFKRTETFSLTLHQMVQAYWNVWQVTLTCRSNFWLFNMWFALHYTDTVRLLVCFCLGVWACVVCMCAVSEFSLATGVHRTFCLKHFRQELYAVSAFQHWSKYVSSSSSPPPPTHTISMPLFVYSAFVELCAYWVRVCALFTQQNNICVEHGQLTNLNCRISLLLLLLLLFCPASIGFVRILLNTSLIYLSTKLYRCAIRKWKNEINLTQCELNHDRSIYAYCLVHSMLCVMHIHTERLSVCF